MITIAFLNLETRKKTYVSFPIGLVPNLSHGISKNEKVSSVESVNDEHLCLHVVLQGLIDIERKKGFKLNILGRTVNARPWIHFIIGDTEGNNKLCAAYTSNNGTTARPNRMCKCDRYLYFEPPECKFVEISEFTDMKKECNELLKTRGNIGRVQRMMKSISRHNILTVWERGVPMADRKHGINLMTPPEVLHVAGTGIAKKLIEILHLELKDQVIV